MRTITINVRVPDDYDVEPLTHRMTDLLAAVRGDTPCEESVPPDMECPSLEYDIIDDSAEATHVELNGRTF